MKYVLVLMALCAPLQAQVLRQNGGIPATTNTPTTFTSTVTITGSGATCFSVDDPTLVVDCGANRVIAGNQVEVRTASSGGDPGVSGTSFGNTRLRLGALDGNVLDFGNHATTPFGVWLQSYDRGDKSINFPIILNPNGGSIGIGTTSPCSTCTLHVAGNINSVGAANLGKKTKAQLDAITPATGDIYTCIDCTVPFDLCVGTGATLSGFRATINSAINTAIPGTLVPKGCGTNN